LKEGNVHAVKVEGPQTDLTARLATVGVPVMAHLGLTPQSVNLFGGYKVQGRTEEAADRIMRYAKELEEAGAFALVLECVPADLGTAITRRLSIPTIGIGAGPYTDGQVLVVNDMAGMTPAVPRFVKRYADVATAISAAAKAFADEVRGGTFPGPEHTYGS
jgi:3-methyl-2-oxobutanoate hydroxymethyltransferase